MISNKQIIHFLSEKNANAGFIDTLKIKYRPFICPFDKLLTYAENKKSIFDIGCGSGQFLSLVGKFIPDVNRLEGIEIDERLVKNARVLTEEFRETKTFNFQKFDGKSIPDNIADFELIYLIDVIHHVPKESQIEFIKEIYKKMSIDSILIFKDIDASSPFVFFNKVHDFVFSGEIGNELSFKKALKIAKETGFHIDESFKQRVFVYPHYFIVCRK